MPFSRYQLRNEYSLADPELYKTADKDDPEALLEGVAMAGLVGVLRQLGDLAEFAAEIFHDLHEEVMVTAARGHDLLVRVQQLESELPSIERAFLSQTGHSAFFSSSGISWHPNLQTEQNLITRGDLPRFVMDSYEECRGPPRLFLLDKFDVAGAGACLKRYTDPSFYKVEASLYEMTSAETQRDKKTRKTKKRGSRWKNGETPEVLQPSHVKLHQLLLEERVQNGVSEPARSVKLKKRQNKFPFDTESGKGYMENLLTSPSEEKLVHEVPVGSSPLTLPANNSGGSGLEILEVSMVNPPLGSPRQNRSPYESPSVDKVVSREHTDNMPENMAKRPVSELPTSSLGLPAGGAYSESQEEVEEKHISVDGECKTNGIQDGYQTDDVASETDNYVDALTTVESETETDAELRANSNPSIKHETYPNANVEQLQSQFSDSQSASDDGSSSIRKKITSSSYSDTTSMSADNTSPGGVDSPQAFACTEIPFHPRVSPNQVSIEASDISSHRSATDAVLHVDEGATFKESTSREADSNEMSSNNSVDLNSPRRTEENQIDPQAITASTSKLSDIHSPTTDDQSSSSFVRNPQCEVDNEDHNSNSSPVISLVEERPFCPSSEELDICDPDVKPSEASFNDDIQAAEEIAYGPDTSSLPKGQLKDDLLESKSDPAEAGVSNSSEETELKESETASVDSETKVASAAVCDPADDGNGDNSLPPFEDEKELEEREPEPVNSETKAVTAAVSAPDDVNSNESKGLSTCEDNTELEGREVESICSETEAVTSALPVPGGIEKNECNGLSTPEEPGENGLVINESWVIQNPNESGEKKESSEQSVISPELDYVPSASYDHSNIQFLDSIPKSSPATCGNVNENDVASPFANLKILQDQSHLVIEETDQNGLQPDVDSQPGNVIPSDQSNAQILDSAPNSPVSTEAQTGLQLDVVTAESSSPKCIDQDLESKSLNQGDHIDKLEAASSLLSHSVPVEEKVDQPHMQSLIQLERVDSQNHVDHETRVDTHSEPYLVNHERYCLEQGEEFQGVVESTTAVVATSESTLKCSSEELSMSNLPQSSSHIKLSEQVEYPLAPAFSGFGMPPQLAPVNLEEMPPLPPLPPMQWRMGKLQNASLTSRPDGGQHSVDHFPPNFPQMASHPSLDQNENTANQKSEHDYEDTESSSQVLPTESSLHREEHDNSVILSEVNAAKFGEHIVPQPPFERELSQNVSTSGREIFWPSSTSSLPPVDDERPNGIRPMKIQRPRTPLIDAVAAHDKSKLRKVSERARPRIPKEEERDTLLEQIRTKSFNLKPAVQTRPSIQGPTTNLRVVAILEKANAIRQAFAGSDDDDDSWGDS